MWISRRYTDQSLSPSSSLRSSVVLFNCSSLYVHLTDNGVACTHTHNTKIGRKRTKAHTLISSNIYEKQSKCRWPNEINCINAPNFPQLLLYRPKTNPYTIRLVYYKAIDQNSQCAVNWVWNWFQFNRTRRVLCDIQLPFHLAGKW